MRTPGHPPSKLYGGFRSAIRFSIGVFRGNLQTNTTFRKYSVHYVTSGQVLETKLVQFVGLARLHQWKKFHKHRFNRKKVINVSKKVHEPIDPIVIGHDIPFELRVCKDSLLEFFWFSPWKPCLQPWKMRTPRSPPVKILRRSQICNQIFNRSFPGGATDEYSIPEVFRLLRHFRARSRNQTCTVCCNCPAASMVQISKGLIEHEKSY
jgi:hypothetical protein